MKHEGQDGRTGDSYFYAMEFVEGETLEKLTKRSGRLEVRLALENTSQVAAGATSATHGCLSLLVPDLAGRGNLWFCVELYGESNHHAFPIVYQVPFDDQLTLSSLSGFDLKSLDELLLVLGPSGLGLKGSGSEQLLVARIGRSVEV